jgi:integrase
MAARPTFRQSDLVRAIRASHKGGLEIARTEIDPDGRIILIHAAAAAEESRLAPSTHGRPAAMRVKLKGVNRIRKRLASGAFVTYYYAWKGGPRLEGEPGSPEFLASYYRARDEERPEAPPVLRTLLDAFQDSTAFTDLAPRTRADYAKHLRIIDRAYGDFPYAALEDRRTRGEFMAWRDQLAQRSRRQADYSYSVLARVLSWALDRGLIAANPCRNGGRVYRAFRSERVWSAEIEAAFYAKAPAHLHLALALALWTGQRQGDLLALTWGAYDGKVLRLVQRKTIRKKGGHAGTRVIIPVGAPLKARLEALRDERRPAAGEHILLTERSTPWTESGFRASWRKACILAGVEGVTFHDLRGTAVTRLALAGATPPEIGTVTGHSLRDVHQILDSHYLSRSCAG